MINNVFDFGDATAKDIMVPKVDMSFLDVNASYGQTMDVYRECRYTRYPVYEDTHVQACSFLFYPVFLLHSEVFSGESTEKRTGPPPGTPGKDSDKKGRFILSPVI